MVAYFVNDRHGDAVSELLLVAGYSQMRDSEDRDPVRHHAAIRHRTATRQSNSLIEAEEHSAVPLLLGRCRPVLNNHGDVIDVPGQLLGNRVEGFGDEFLEAI